MAAFIWSAICLHAFSRPALVLGFLAASDHALRTWSSCPWNVVLWAAGTLVVTHASYFFRKSSQAAMPVVWAPSPVLRHTSRPAAAAVGRTRTIRLLLSAHDVE